LKQKNGINNEKKEMIEEIILVFKKKKKIKIYQYQQEKNYMYWLSNENCMFAYKMNKKQKKL